MRYAELSRLNIEFFPDESNGCEVQILQSRPNRQLVKRLEDLGFRDIHYLPNGVCNAWTPDSKTSRYYAYHEDYRGLMDRTGLEGYWDRLEQKQERYWRNKGSGVQ